MKVLIIVCRIMLVVTCAWGMVDFGVGTLHDIIVRYLGVPEIWAVAIASIMVGTFGALSLFRIKKKQDNDKR